MACLDTLPTNAVPTDTYSPDAQKWLDDISDLKREHPVLRWDGKQKAHMQWDGLLFDSELWKKNGDCQIFLHSSKINTASPSFFLNDNLLDRSRYPGLVESATYRLDQTTSMKNIYLPAMAEMGVDALKYHLSTRNFLAYLAGVPLVGASLADSIVELYKRIRVWSEEPLTVKDSYLRDRRFLAYLELMGYLDFVNCPGHSLAALRLAELCCLHRKLRANIYCRAFCHSVGMFSSLQACPDFYHLSFHTRKSLRQSLTRLTKKVQDLHNSVYSFLADDLSPTRLGLIAPSRSHLIRFQSFFTDFYRAKFQSWPPVEANIFPKILYKALLDDFRVLFNYLVDQESTKDLVVQKTESSGICVLQNVLAFDERHGFTTTSQPLPLLPEIPVSWDPASDTQDRYTLTTYGASLPTRPSLKRTNTWTGVSANPKPSKAETTQRISCSLKLASNPVACSPLLELYILHFESAPPAEKVTVVEARKVRWFLIYGMVQVLNSALRAPPEAPVIGLQPVEPLYPLCATVPSSFPWTPPQSLNTGVGALPTLQDQSISRTASDASHPTGSPLSRSSTRYSTTDGDSPLPRPDESCTVPQPSRLPTLSILTPDQTFTVRPDCETDDYLGLNSCRRRASSGKADSRSSKPATPTDRNRQRRSMSVLMQRPPSALAISRRLRRNPSARTQSSVSRPNSDISRPSSPDVNCLGNTKHLEVVANQTVTAESPSPMDRRSSFRAFGQQITASLMSKRGSSRRGSTAGNTSEWHGGDGNLTASPVPLLSQENELGVSAGAVATTEIQDSNQSLPAPHSSKMDEFPMYLADADNDHIPKESLSPGILRFSSHGSKSISMLPKSDSLLSRRSMACDVGRDNSGVEESGSDVFTSPPHDKPHQLDETSAKYRTWKFQMRPISGVSVSIRMVSPDTINPCADLPPYLRLRPASASVPPSPQTEEQVPELILPTKPERAKPEGERQSTLPTSALRKVSHTIRRSGRFSVGPRLVKSVSKSNPSRSGSPLPKEWMQPKAESVSSRLFSSLRMWKRSSG